MAYTAPMLHPNELIFRYNIPRETLTDLLPIGIHSINSYCSGRRQPSQSIMALTARIAEKIEADPSFREQVCSAETKKKKKS